ncbi:hypothetical protein P43SY_001358 [Pythium insidiosum]|uniref:Protein kinase domain-containing protein n=1 Tax=Pythium insidiosum TaxID=114742 RepID=A0AAD5Q8I9_PYTIN|nr:hypothetical protein P43SY_001358 [Pythium insidiosum]
MTPTEATAVVHDGFQRVMPPASETMALQVAVSAQHLCIVANTENEVHCRPRASDGAPSWRQIKNAVAWISLSSETLWAIGAGNNNNNKGLVASSLSDAAGSSLPTTVATSSLRRVASNASHVCVVAGLTNDALCGSIDKQLTLDERSRVTTDLRDVGVARSSIYGLSLSAEDAYVCVTEQGTQDVLCSAPSVARTKLSIGKAPLDEADAAPRTEATPITSAPASAADSTSIPSVPATTTRARGIIGMAVGIPILLLILGVHTIISYGAYGEVYRGSYLGRPVAIKRLLPEKTRLVHEIAAFAGEARLMATLEHECIVRFVGVAWSKPSDLCVVTELMTGGDVRQLLHTYKTTGRPQGLTRDKLRIAVHVARALTYLHSLDPVLLHRDLKSRNILLTVDGDAKVTDFGVAREWEDLTMTEGVGSLLWMAPEVVQGERYDEKADIYSLGVVLSELDTNELPFSHAMSYNSVVQCSGSTANGRRCDLYGQINAGRSFFFCRHHFICRGKTQDGRACSRAVASGIYCCAAHNPALNRYRSSEFRDDGLMLSRWQVLQRHNFLDYYTDAELDEIETHRDHIVECQVAAHVFNGLYRVYRQNGWDEEEIDAAVPMVSYFLNREANVVPVHEDINIVKGSGVTSFLEERAVYGYARFTPHLLHAHERLSDRQLGRMLWTSIGRATAYSIKKAVWKQLEELEHMLDSQADCETMGDLATHVGSLRRNVKNS